MIKEILVEMKKEIKVVFPFFGLKSKDVKEYQKIAKSFDVKFDSTWDSSNPDEYRMFGSKENIEKFLSAVGKKDLINQI
jgi:hypothetical protein